jgi:hypothetical protein
MANGDQFESLGGWGDRAAPEHPVERQAIGALRTHDRRQLEKGNRPC